MRQNLSSFKITGVYTTHTKTFPVLLELSNLSHLFIMRHHSFTTINFLALFEWDEVAHQPPTSGSWNLVVTYTFLRH